MNRYILLYQGKDSPTEAERDWIRSLPGVKFLDASSPRMWLIEASSAALAKLRDRPSWSVTAETYVPLPDTRKKIKQV
jgi:hypothetical protein